ncbi:MucR family transcriptional regulator [Acetobacter orientalis]|uniref:MucR family transcriptional regulator n=1 Tax=Acetobacter orientalis TaxID=146474 RepID=A0A252BDS5_9PROT|nr:MucR family transcriptional regulator [Acetobacter orientalis]MDN6041617.1 MucR family transcriptional regulator [Acetobacter sp.]MCP1214534.1 MucR family transcriptional regulator [Acetobacter orientalis]MCP1218116.1 MucR family transcriptional regulator [Acetobacter orientalis]MCP1221096.1 MucR family transcriptional regulator [Acetobacter orientalis]OUI80785.1 MucR family transcriptional regulator [Acetobacter orientalis]
MSENQSYPIILDLVAEIVSAQVSSTQTDPATIPALIKDVYQALKTADQPQSEPEKLQPAVPVKRSVFPDYIVCLEDGKKLKMLKRHLQSAYGMTPEQYRERWGLPADYPMVAPNYAERRSTLAREIGLGRKIHATAEGEETTGRGRRSKKQAV